MAMENFVQILYNRIGILAFLGFLAVRRRTFGGPQPENLEIARRISPRLQRLVSNLKMVFKKGAVRVQNSPHARHFGL